MANKNKKKNSKPTPKKTNSQPAVAASSKKKEKTGLFAFFRGVRQELKKVVWPTKEELTTDTIVVIACVVFFAVAFWLIDTGFLAALKGILGITLS